MKFLLHKDRKEIGKPAAHFSTFGFARHKSQRFAKPKEPFFCQRTDIVSTLKLILTD